MRCLSRSGVTGLDSTNLAPALMAATTEPAAPSWLSTSTGTREVAGTDFRVEASARPRSLGTSSVTTTLGSSLSQILNAATASPTTTKLPSSLSVGPSASTVSSSAKRRIFGRGSSGAEGQWEGGRPLGERLAEALEARGGEEGGGEEGGRDGGCDDGAGRGG